MSHHFQRCTKLIDRIPVFCLQRENSLAALDEIAQLIESHLAQAKTLAV